MDILTSCFLIGVLMLLGAATIGVVALRRYVDYGVDPAILDTFQTRLRVWWILFGSIACAFMFGPLATIFLFFILSIAVLREYITLTPKSPVDHQALFWIYVFFTPLQFILVGINPDWFEALTGLTPYRFFSVLLPGYVFLILPGFMATADDPKRFLERIAKLQLGLIICVYSLSYAPGLLTMQLPKPETPETTITSGILDQGLENVVIETLTPTISTTIDKTLAVTTNNPLIAHVEPTEKNLLGHSETVDVKIPLSTLSTDHPEQKANQNLHSNDSVFQHRIIPTMSGRHFRLLFFFVVVVQFGDIFQYLWSQIPMRHPVAPKINTTRTWEGVFGGAVTAALLGVALWYFTPFPKWWQAGFIALITALLGFCGNMTMSAIKRDRGVSGYGSLIQGHRGLLDRIDSLCFAAPVFYHLAWLFSR